MFLGFACGLFILYTSNLIAPGNRWFVCIDECHGIYIVCKRQKCCGTGNMENIREYPTYYIFSRWLARCRNCSKLLKT